MIAVSKKNVSQYKVVETADPLRASGGDVGGRRVIGHLLYQRTVGALQYDDYKGPNRQYVEANKLVIEVWK